MAGLEGVEELQLSKKPWQSKVMVVNGVLGLLCFVALFVPGADMVGGLIKSNPQVVGMVWAVLNMLLRLITKDKISLDD